MHNKIQTNKKNIVILGAGFCGINTAKQLAKKLRFNGSGQQFQIILVDRKTAQTYSGDLYEISTAYNKRISESCMSKLKDAVCIQLGQVFMGLPVTFLRDEVATIDPTAKKIMLKNSGELVYEYLVLALGSVTNYYNIPGLQEHAFPLKTLEDALAINCHFDQFFRERWGQNHTSNSGGHHKKVHIVVGGGGFTGVEYACELTGCVKKLSEKYHFNPAEVEISIVQGTDNFVGLGEKVSKITVRRFKKLGIKPIINTQIMAYDGQNLTIKTETDTTNIAADLLVWTGGIKPNSILKNFPILDSSGALEVYPTLESPHYPKVYAGGDNAAIFDPNKHQLIPKLAQLAIQQGKLIATNISNDINKKPQKSYKPLFKGFILPLGGTYFLYHRDNITFSGIIPYIMRKVVDLMYFLSLLPLKSAFKKWQHSENIFLQND